MSDNTEFGRSQGAAVIQGIPTEQYRFRTTNTDVPIYNFSKSISGRSMVFEILSTAFKNSEEIYEEDPVPGTQLGFVYRQDGQGAGSANTGFYFMFKQGSLEVSNFNINVPTTNDSVAVETDGINNNDIWLFKMNPDGTQSNKWTKVSSLVGNNIAYNSLSGNLKNIYAVRTRSNDRVTLEFADGVYGNLPQGPFRLYYRVSNGLTYSISPSEVRGVDISVQYLSKSGAVQTLTIGLALESTVLNASAQETTDQIRQNAPAQYYTQNRMITGEDYNLAPLSTSQNILKVKAVNRTSSGISRNFDIIDASGKYSSVNMFGDDGFIYKEESEKILNFKFVTRTEIINFVRRSVEKVFTDTDVYNYYFTKFPNVIFTESNTQWTAVTNTLNSGTGYFTNIVDQSLLKVGTYATNTLKYLKPGALIKFLPPSGKSFKNGLLVDTNADDFEQTSYVWTKVINVAGDGTNAGRGALSSGLGPITFNDNIPTGSIASEIVPKFVNDISSALESEIVNLMFASLNFGLRYDTVESAWKIIQSQNLNLTADFSLGKAGDITNENLDSSWIVSFVKDNDQYVVRVRKLDYVFGSVQQNRFYFDKNEKAYNNLTGKLVYDTVKVLGINKKVSSNDALVLDYQFKIDDTIQFDDGYESTKEIKIAFNDKDDDGVIDDPQAFIEIVGSDLDLNFLFFKETKDSLGSIYYDLVDTDVTPISLVQRESSISINDYDDGDLVYFYDVLENRVKRADRSTNTWVLESTYKAVVGRKNLKFQYTHAASEDRRIDPSSTNIIDLYLLTRSYDTQFRNYLAGAISSEPTAPTTDSLRIDFGKNLNAIKTVSDEIIYHPVKYKILFGSTADIKLQAQFKIVKNPNVVVNDNNLKVRIVDAINSFFSVNNWDFGDRFYLSELTTYIINTVAPDVSNLIILPRQESQVFGSLFEIQSKPDEIFVSGATVDDITIVTSITAAEIRAGTGSVVSNT
jgi:hypothetical protein